MAKVIRLTENQLRQLILEEMDGSGEARQALQQAVNALDKAASLLGHSPSGPQIQKLANAAHQALQGLH